MKKRGREIRMASTGSKSTNPANVWNQNAQNCRLKPLYDAIDSQRCKDAIEIADRITRKFENKDRGVDDRATVTTAKALKALALIRSEKATDAGPLMNVCEEAMLTDEFNEGTMTESYVPHRIPQLLERVLEKREKTENLLSELYYGYARVCDFKNQGRVANMLFREYKHNRYLIWGAVSVIMQGVTNPALAKKVFYPLGLGMLEKALAGRKHTRSEIHLYFAILWYCEMYDKAIEYIQTLHGDNDEKIDGTLTQLECDQMLLTALETSELYDGLFALSNRMIKETGFDNFAPWKALLCVMDKLIARKEKEQFRVMLEECAKLVVLAEEASGSSHLNRYYKHTLRLLFLIRIVKSGYSTIENLRDFTPNFGNFVEHMKATIEITYNRPYCFNDMSQFFSMLRKSDRAELLEFLDIKFGLQIDELLKQNRIDYEYMIRELFRVGFGFYEEDDSKKKREYVLALVTLLHRQSPETQNIEDFAKSIAIIVGNVMWDVYIETGSKDYLYEASVMLESIYNSFPNVYVAGLLLARIYDVIGNIQRIMMLHNELGIKFIQRESLGYLTFNSAVKFGRFKEAIFYFTSITSQFDQNERETCESIVTSNKVTGLEKVPQLINYLETCRNSLFARGADVLNQTLSACFAVDSLNMVLVTLYGDDERIEWNKVTDTRDFIAIQCFCISDETVTVDYFRLYHLLSKLIGLTGTIELDKLTFDGNYAALRSHYDYCKSVYPESQCARYLQGFSAPALIPLVQHKFLWPTFALLDVCAEMMNVQENIDESKLCDLLEIATKAIDKPDFFQHLDQCELDCEPAEFLVNCSHAMLLMTLNAILLKFLEARAQLLVSILKSDDRTKKLDSMFKNAAQISEPINGTNTSSSTAKGKKNKKQNAKTYEEMSIQEKIPEAFRIAYGNLNEVVNEFETRMRTKLEIMEKFDTFCPVDSLDFKAANMDAAVQKVDQSLFDSYCRTLGELILCSVRIQMFFRLQDFSLMSMHFDGDINDRN
ncbi:N-terminal acetyltransferase B complex subunit MDM20-like protein [Aphelenchoides besseyi]|nr:N-terminal acetyltransferase B complex subunit MDM20-like protein [Aphelenchoides besseyi]KAI6195440.1 N-terminal acetyltransferase B complex subunit MDM20-like protein [Aphelenchoides besseyi]